MAPQSLPRPLLVVFALTLLASFPVPGAVSQVGTYCPAGDGGPAPPNGSQPQLYLDLAPTNLSARLTPAGGSAVQGELTGVYFTFASAGSLNVTYTMDNIGTADPAAGATTKVRVVLGRPDGTTATVTHTVNVPTAAGAAVSGSATFSITAGRHTVLVEVNPDRSLAESCTDTALNPACTSGGVPTQCTQTYYNNNVLTRGILASSLPDLEVSLIQSAGPIRATQGASTDSEATVKVAVRNAGTQLAFNLSAVNPGAQPFHVRVAVPGCVCNPVLLAIGQIAAGAEVEVSTKLNLQGLKNTFVAEVELDRTDWVVESDETDNEGNATFPIPTPDLIASVDADLPFSEGAYLLPKGRAFHFNVTVTNDGDAEAKKTSGANLGFRVFGYRDSATNGVLDERLTLGAHSSVVYAIRDDAENLTGSHEYKITVDQQLDVLESTETNNDVFLRVVVAVYDLDLDLEEADRETTVPPGVSGHIPFSVTNDGTVTDTIEFIVPAADRSVLRYRDEAGQTIGEISLAAGATFTGELERDIPSTALRDDEFPATITVRSRGSGNVSNEDVTFVVGDDTVAPTIVMQDPASLFLSGDSVVLRVTDNVAVQTLETDVSGSLAATEPDVAGGTLYTVNVAGRPTEFTLTVRATDAAGNVANQAFALVRDVTAPRIASATFTPSQGVTPGSLVTLVVDARDDNLASVSTTIWQPRPGDDFRDNLTLVRQGQNYLLRDWVVPERPGHYVFNITALDRAGNEALDRAILFVPGLDIRLLGNPTARPAVPREGDRVQITYVLENTSPDFETGPFLVAFVVDLQPGVDTPVSLDPGEREPVSFFWTARPGFHDFTLIIDRAQQVAEDVDGNENVFRIGSDTLFRDQKLFEPSGGDSDLVTFQGRLGQYWFLPVLAAATVALFVIALVLSRRTPA